MPGQKPPRRVRVTDKSSDVTTVIDLPALSVPPVPPRADDTPTPTPEVLSMSDESSKAETTPEKPDTRPLANERFCAGCGEALARHSADPPFGTSSGCPAFNLDTSRIPHRY